MKVVIDTNVVVSAVLRDRNPETVILFIIGKPEFEWVASREIVEEYIGVLSREHFALPTEILDKWADFFMKSYHLQMLHQRSISLATRKMPGS